MPERPNIVLIVSDDHGREALGCYGNPVVRTPNLDALAAEGVRFTHSFCTTASCAASRSVILTGLHNHANGTYGHTHGRHHFACFHDVVTLPRMIGDAGYRTGRVGKRHYAPEAAFPWDWQRPEDECGRDDVRMAETCREFVSGSEPFFLYYCSRNPHRAGTLESHPLRPDHFGNPTRSFPGDTEQPVDEAEVIIPRFLPDTPEVRAELAQYYQSIARLDRGVGRLMQVLREAGRYDNTLVIYVSDNGAAFPHAKTTLYEPGMRLPCIVRSPDGAGRGRTCDGLISWADLTPTILDFADAGGEPGRFHGRSFRRIIDRQSPADWRGSIHASHTFHEITNYYPMRVVRTHRWKFIWNIAFKLDYSFASDLWASASWQGARRDGLDRFGVRSMEAYAHRPRFELYDLHADPDEVYNLADDPARQELVESFAREIRQFQEATGDPWLHKWEYE
ncbi:MAG: Arylsulfatase [Phycisphaerae bacterium]|nr:Arylsulfatase [Phycisphaerae bacterium]